MANKTPSVAAEYGLTTTTQGTKLSEYPGENCRELTTLRVARLDDGAELKVTDPKEQQRDVEEEEAEDKERRERVDC